MTIYNNRICICVLLVALSLVTIKALKGAERPAVAVASGVTVKCGRDSAYLICRSLGVEADPAEIDSALGSRAVVSLGDIRRVLQQKGLFCRSISTPAGALGRLGESLEVAPSQLAVIVAMPSRSGNTRHFAVLLNADEESVTLLDTSAGGRVDVKIADIGPATDVPMLVIGRNEAIVKSFGASAPSLLVALERTYSSPLLTIGLALAIALVFSPQSAVLATITRLRFMSRHVVFPRLLQTSHRWLWRGRVAIVAVAGGTAVAIAVNFWGLGSANSGDILIEPSTIDVGRVPVGSQQVVHCSVYNRGHTVERIDGIWRSCSCLNVDLAEQQIPGGGKASLKVSFVVAAAGQTEQLVSLTPTRGSSQAARVRIKYDAFDAVRLEPVFFNVGEFPSGTTTEKIVDLSIKDFEGEAASFESIEPTGSIHALDATFLGPHELRKGGILKLRLAARPEAPLGRFAQNFVLLTAKRLSRSFVIVAHGAIVPAVRVEPQSLVLNPERSGGGSVSSTLTIRSLAGPLEIAQIVAEPAIFRVDVEKQSSDGMEATLRVHLEERSTESTSGIVKIALTRPSQEELRIPVYPLAEPVAVPSISDAKSFNTSITPADDL